MLGGGCTGRHEQTTLEGSGWELAVSCGDIWVTVEQSAEWRRGDDWVRGTALRGPRRQALQTPVLCTRGLVCIASWERVSSSVRISG